MRKRLRQTTIDVRKLMSEPVLLVIVLAIFALLGLYIAYPLLCVLHTALFQEGRSTLAAFSDIVTKSYYYIPFLHSVTVGFWVAVIGTFVGYVFAYSITRVVIPGKRFFRVIATFPIISPPFVVAMAGILLLGRNGWITNLLYNRGVDIYRMGFEIFGFNGLVLFETLSYFPMAFLLLVGVLGALDTSLEEAALDLGASRWRVFFTVTLPLSLPGIAASMLLLFIESLADFGTPIIISGNYEVLTAQAYLLVVGTLNDLQGASLLAIMLLMPSLIAFIVQKYWLERKSFVTVTGKPVGGAIKEVSLPAKAGFFSTCLFFTGIILAFYGMVVFGSFTKQWGADNSLTIKNYVELFTLGSDYFRAVATSLYLAAIATPLTGLLGMMIAFLVARRRFPGKGVMEFVAMLTFATPGTFVGIGYILAFNNPPFDNPPLQAVGMGSAFLIIMLFTFRNAPVGIRSGIASLSQIDPAIEEASLDLGASSTKTFFTVTLPLIAPAFFSGLAYSFVKCMTAISAVIFLSTGNLPLITIAILESIDNSDYSQAAALSVVLMVFVLIVLGVIQLLVGSMGSRGLKPQAA